MEDNSFGKKAILWVFSAIALFFGFWFLDSGITGNAIVNELSPVNLLPVMGLLLIAGSVVLISYAVKKK